MEEPVSAGLVAEVVEQQVETVRAEHLLDSGDDLAEEPPVDIGDHDADRSRASGREPGGAGGHDISQLLGGRQNPGPRGGRDARQAAECA